MYDQHHYPTEKASALRALAGALGPRAARPGNRMGGELKEKIVEYQWEDPKSLHYRAVLTQVLQFALFGVFPVNSSIPDAS